MIGKNGSAGFRHTHTAVGAACATLALLACVWLCAAHWQPISSGMVLSVAGRGKNHGLLAAASLSAGSVDVNTADEKALEVLDGIGPKLAQAIVAERMANGPFNYPEDLLSVKGIGPGKLANFYSQLYFPMRDVAP